MQNSRNIVRSTLFHYHHDGVLRKHRRPSIIFLASKNLIDATDDHPPMLKLPIILPICTCVFILREMVDFRSVGVGYIHDHWSWNEIICIIFLLISVNHMIQMVSTVVYYFSPFTTFILLIIFYAFFLVFW